MEATLNNGRNEGETGNAAGQLASQAGIETVARGATSEEPRGGGINGAEYDAADETAEAAQPRKTATTPPYWQNMHSHRRRASTNSSGSGPTGAITLVDNEADDEEDRNNACWAKSVEIVDYTVVNGGATSIGAFVVWNVRVQTLHGGYMNIRKRYSEFDALRYRLMKSFPNFDAAVPSLPPKSVISKFRPKFLEKRRAGLQYFLNCIMLNPEFSGSPVLKEFLFS